MGIIGRTKRTIWMGLPSLHSGDLRKGEVFFSSLVLEIGNQLHPPIKKEKERREREERKERKSSKEEKGRERAAQ